MIHWRSGVVREITRVRAGTSEVRVEVDAQSVPALALTELVGSPTVGDTVLLNTSALRRRLGTGGYALVIANVTSPPPDPPSAPGHIIKARYTPLQTMVCALEEQESQHHAAMRDHPDVAAGDLHGMPVVVTELHSGLPAVLTGLRAVAPAARVVYVMTDTAALPMALSHTVASLNEAEWLAATITCGQAFGGQYEAITVHSALLAARHVLGCDVAIVAQGPGNAGSSTTWGWSGLATGEVLNAVHILGGQAIAVPRVSDSDRRPRHRGLSHHTDTVLRRAVLGSAEVVVPDAQDELWSRVRAQLQDTAAHAAGDVTLLERSAEEALRGLSSSPVPLSSMGRAAAEDVSPFVAAALAGRRAAELIE